MSALFVDFDAAGDLAIWRANPDRPESPTAIVRRCDVSGEAWSVLLAGVESLTEAVLPEDWCGHNPEWADGAGRCRHWHCTVAGPQVYVTTPEVDQ